MHGVQVRYLGGLWALLTCINQGMAGDVLDLEDSWREWFSELRIWRGQSFPYQRIAWVFLQGLPPQLWDGEVFDLIVKRLGTVVHRSDVDLNDCNMARNCIGVLVEGMAKVEGVIKVRWGDHCFDCRVSEMHEDCEPDFVSVVTKKEQGGNSVVTPEGDVRWEAAGAGQIRRRVDKAGQVSGPCSWASQGGRGDGVNVGNVGPMEKDEGNVKLDEGPVEFNGVHEGESGVCAGNDILCRSSGFRENTSIPTEISRSKGLSDPNEGIQEDGGGRATGGRGEKDGNGTRMANFDGRSKEDKQRLEDLKVANEVINSLQHIPKAAYRRYFHSQRPSYDINFYLRLDLRFIVGLHEIDQEMFITRADNGVGNDLCHLAPNYAILVHWSDDDDDVDEVIAPPSAPAEAGQPEPPAEADQTNDVQIAPVITFSEIGRINKNVAYKVPPKVATLVDLAETMLLNIKVEDQEVYVAEVRKEDTDRKPRNWSITILADNGVGNDLCHLAPNYAIPVHWSDDDDDVDEVIAPPSAPAEAGQPEPPAEADQTNDVQIGPVITFSEIGRINKNVAYKVPPKVATLVDLAETMLLNIKVEDQEVYVAEVRKEDTDRKPRKCDQRKW
ncbi:hypothetical protein SSX86_023899 [Deinandra increscens subsp. villosa]|uniref:DUF4283 domain-containing protein n=1 Tax=Deinandra increscens subsp. villosa TaxID=3103831 RepID=A0AAP0CLT6_9ASTR